MRDNERCGDRPYTDESYEPCEAKVSNDLRPEHPTQRANNIIIESLDHGYIVRVGCQRFAVEDADKMLKYITMYLKDPQAIETKWFNKEINLND